MDRRDFLGCLTAMAVPAVFSSACASALRKAPPRCNTDSGFVLLPTPGKLIVFDLARKTATKIAAPILNPHSVTMHPLKPNLALLVGQNSDQACLIDLRQRKVLQECVPEKGFLFSGHGCFSADGSSLYMPEYPQDLKQNGVVVVRDPQLLKEQRRFTAHAVWSHNVALIRNESVLMVGHLGTEGKVGEPLMGGQITFLSPETGEKLGAYLPPDPYWFMAHFDVANDETIVVGTQSYYGEKQNFRTLVSPVLFGKMGEETWSLQLPERYRERMRHNHTVKVHRARDRALVVHRHGNLVSVWNIAQRECIRGLEIENPQGVDITPCEGFYVINSKANKIHLVNVETLEIVSVIAGMGFDSPEGAPHIAVISEFG